LTGSKQNEVVAQVELSVSQQSVGGYPVLAVKGEVDVYSASALQDGLTGLLDSDTHAVVVDLSEIGFLDSTGLGALVAARSTAAEGGGRLPVVCDRERILKLFRITGLDGVFEIYSTVDDAVRALGAEAPTT
jgi:anti-sigma B factor antagonist